MNNPERVDRIRDALRKDKWDLVVCALPMNVLLLSGYWPVVGSGVAVASSDGRISLLVPEDEEDLAKRGWADEVRTFKPGSLNQLITTVEAIRAPLRELAQSFCAGRFGSALRRRRHPSRHLMPQCTSIAERCGLCSMRRFLLRPSPPLMRS